MFYITFYVLHIFNDLVVSNHFDKDVFWLNCSQGVYCVMCFQWSKPTWFSWSYYNNYVSPRPTYGFVESFFFNSSDSRMPSLTNGHIFWGVAPGPCAVDLRNDSQCPLQFAGVGHWLCMVPKSLQRENENKRKNRVLEFPASFVTFLLQCAWVEKSKEMWKKNAFWKGTDVLCKKLRFTLKQLWSWRAWWRSLGLSRF